MDFDFFKDLFWCDSAGGIFGGAFVVNKKINLMKVRKIKRIL